MQRSPIQSKTVLELKLPGIDTVVVDYLISRGTFGTVWKVYNPLDRRPYAIKHIQLNSGIAEATRAELIHAIEKEAKVGEKVSSPYIVKSFGYKEIEPDHFVILFEYIEGKDLKNWIDIVGPHTPWAVKKTLFGQILEGVRAAHAANIIHRDIKPENIYIADNDMPKIIDFGLAKFKDQTLSMSSAVKGTWAYMAPEELSKFFGDEMAISIPPAPTHDVYGLGITLYELVMGQAPWEANDLNLGKFTKYVSEHDRHNILDLDQAFKHKFNFTGDPVVAELIRQSTVFNFEARLKSVDAMIGILSRQGGTASQGAEQPPRRSDQQSLPEQPETPLTVPPIPKKSVPPKRPWFSWRMLRNLTLLLLLLGIVAGGIRFGKTLWQSKPVHDVLEWLRPDPTPTPQPTATPRPGGSLIKKDPTPTPMPSSTPLRVTPTPTPTPSSTPLRVTPAPTWTPTPKPTFTPTAVPTFTPTPEPTFTPTPTVERLLDDAAQYVRKQWLTTPENTNAFAVYQEVLRRDPANAEALNGLGDMATLYKTWADAAYDAKKDSDAQTFYARYLTVAEELATRQADSQRTTEIDAVRERLKLHIRGVAVRDADGVHQIEPEDGIYYVFKGETLTIVVDIMALAGQSGRLQYRAIKQPITDKGIYRVSNTPGDKDIITITVTDRESGRVVQEIVPVVVMGR